MRAMLALTAFEDGDPTLAPDMTKVLFVDREGLLQAGIISKALYRKWSRDIAQFRISNNTFASIVDFTLAEEGVSASRVIAISSDEIAVLREITDIALKHPESLSGDNRIPEHLRWAPYRIIDTVIKLAEEDKDYIAHMEKSIKDNIGRDALIELERKGRFIENIAGKSSLALCIWRMGIQPQGMNSYPTLIFTHRATFELYIIEMPPVINDARQAVCNIFGVTKPIEVFVERPRGLLAFKYLLKHLKPTNLFNPKYIPHQAIIPARNDNKICLCLEPNGEFLHVGLVIENGRLAMARVRKNVNEVQSIINLVAGICRDYFCAERSLSEDVVGSLAALLAEAEAENLGLLSGSI
ncbi:MAG: hypothetical protein ACUVV0_17260 [Anaerolineae bacterium]